uniref:Uncharacterized protein n=1 Tax=Desertifilum tharense IPPAS B-1220 TaxID=1781255 RepID=A0ACD5H6C8_9CYAN
MGGWGKKGIGSWELGFGGRRELGVGIWDLGEEGELAIINIKKLAVGQPVFKAKSLRAR